MTLQSHDIWGITESRERALHLQSYFVVFERSALKFLRDWLSTFQYLEDKDALIMRFEIGMSESARARGLRLGAWVPSSTIDTLIQRQLNAMNGTDVPTGLNPTHTHWREIVLHAGSPFIKRDLVRAAEGSAEGQRAWRLLLAEVGATGLTALIEDYLTDGSRISSQPHCFSMNDGLNP
jgi:hypothetical protein